MINNLCKVKLLILVLLISIKVQSQEKVFYSNDRYDYSFLIPRDATVQRFDIEGEGYFENFIIPCSQNDKQYSLTVTRLKGQPVVETNYFQSQFYKQSFINSCKCNIEGNALEVTFNNANAIRYIVNKKEDGITIKGYADHISIGEVFYIITLFGEVDNFKTYSIDYENVMNTFIINR